MIKQNLRLDNTVSGVVEVNPSLLCNQMTEHVIYIKKSKEFSLSYDNNLIEK